MDPISLAVLAALAGGAGGELGRQAWAGLTGVIRRRRNASRTTPDTPSPSGDGAGDATAVQDEPATPTQAALAALEEQPNDLSRAGELERTLRAQQETDPDFARAMAMWAASFQATLAADPEAAEALADAARALAPQEERADAGAVHNDFRHGTFKGPVQGSGTQNITYRT